MIYLTETIDNVWIYWIVDNFGVFVKFKLWIKLNQHNFKVFSIWEMSTSNLKSHNLELSYKDFISMNKNLKGLKVGKYTVK